MSSNPSGANRPNGCGLCHVQYWINAMADKNLSIRQSREWFAKNLNAVPSGVIGNCSACIFRDAPNYCAKMSCTYFDNDTDFIETVYWRGTQTHANLATWPELRNWFAATPSRRIMDISGDIVKQSVMKKIKYSR